HRRRHIAQECRAEARPTAVQRRAWLRPFGATADEIERLIAPARAHGTCSGIAVSAAPELELQAERTSLSKEALKRSFLDNLFYIQGKFPALATRVDYYMALAYTVRHLMLQRCMS